MGGSPIASFEDGTAEADTCEAMYEDVARACLTNTRWRFATNQSVLTRLSTAPTGRFDAAYQLPATMLMLNAITVNDFPIEYDLYGDKAYCNAVPTDVVIADFIFRAQEANWPAYFTIGVEFSMAAILAVSVARDPQLASLMEQKSNLYMMQARRLDSQQQTTRKLYTSRFIAQRRS
jgi:hypothetical protein